MKCSRRGWTGCSEGRVGGHADGGEHAGRTSRRGRTVGEQADRRTRAGRRADGLADWRTSRWGPTVEDGFSKGKTPKLTHQLTWRPKSNVDVLW